MKVFALLTAFFMCATAAFAQHTQTRETYFGVSDASVTSYGTTTVHDTLGATIDSIRFAPNKKITIVQVNLRDSAAVKLVTGALFYGDIVYVDVVNPTITGNTITLYGNWIVSTGTKRIALTSAKSSMLKFWFNGVDLVEESRNLNYTR